MTQPPQSLNDLRTGVPGRDAGAWACRDDLELIFDLARPRTLAPVTVAVYMGLCFITAEENCATLKTYPRQIQQRCECTSRISPKNILDALSELKRLGIIRLRKSERPWLVVTLRHFRPLNETPVKPSQS